MPASHAAAEPQASACAKTYPLATVDATQQPINIGQLKSQLYFYACSGAYDADLNKIMGEALAYIEKRAGEVTKPAVVLDIDETSLSNLPQELANDFGYITGKTCDIPAGPCGWDGWIESGKAKAFDGTLALFAGAKSRGVAVFFVTGRRQRQETATVDNLKAAGYAGWAGLSLRPNDDHGTVVSYKSGERAKIEAQGYRIIANMGDQQSDLDGGYAERAYKLPNPFYFIP